MTKRPAVVLKTASYVAGALATSDVGAFRPASARAWVGSAAAMQQAATIRARFMQAAHSLGGYCNHFAAWFVLEGASCRTRPNRRLQSHPSTSLPESRKT